MSTTSTQDLGAGFRFHGVATPVSNHRGTVATVDGQGRNVVLVWLYDHRGGYALLVIDADTGKTLEIPVPFPFEGDGPFASILSSANRLYSHYGSHFVEFDPASCSFTFVGKTVPQMAMSMTEDDTGRIWSATYPSSGVACFDPATRELRDYGHVYAQEWRQYPRSLAVDDAGWAYLGIGYAANQIVCLDPSTGAARPLLAEAERRQGGAMVERDENGRVYGLRLEREPNEWIELYRGEARAAGARTDRRPRRFAAGSQTLFHTRFPDGSILESCDLSERRLVVRASDGAARPAVRFDYSSDGAHLMGLAAAPDGRICGGTAFPMCFFGYDPRSDAWEHRDCFGQWNTVVRQGDRFFVGAYSGGFLLEWDPGRPWVPTVKGEASSNPRLHLDCEPDINRPHELLAHPDGKTIVLAGTPGYGHTGGGLLFWDRATATSTLVRHVDILPEHSTMSLAALPDGKILGGTTTSAGTGGAKKADEAELYLMDLATKRVEWHRAVLPGAQAYVDLLGLENGLVVGFADRTRLFVFDSRRREVVHVADTSAGPGPCVSHQGPRVFHRGPGGTLYALFASGIARIEPGTWRVELLATSPVPIDAGGDILDGRIWFASGSKLYSWALPSR